MKSLITVIVLMFSNVVFAGGELVFKPYKNTKSEHHSVLMGLSTEKKLMGPIVWTNFTGINEQHVEGTDHNLADIHFNNGIAFKPMDKLHIEAGLELHKDVEAKADISETVYGKIKVKLW